MSDPNQVSARLNEFASLREALKSRDPAQLLRNASPNERATIAVALLSSDQPGANEIVLDLLRSDDDPFVLMCLANFAVSAADETLLTSLLTKPNAHPHCVFALLQALKYQKRRVTKETLLPLERNESPHVRLALLDYYGFIRHRPAGLELMLLQLRSDLRAYRPKDSLPSPSPVFSNHASSIRMLRRVKSSLQSL